jgi:hypothetical protein
MAAWSRREQYDKERTEPHEWLEPPFTPHPSHSQLLTSSPAPTPPPIALQVILTSSSFFTPISSVLSFPPHPYHFPSAYLQLSYSSLQLLALSFQLPTLLCNSLPLPFSFLLFPADPYPFLSVSLYSFLQLLIPSLQFPTLPCSFLPLSFRFLLFPAAPYPFPSVSYTLPCM